LYDKHYLLKNRCWSPRPLFYSAIKKEKKRKNWFWLKFHININYGSKFHWTDFPKIEAIVLLQSDPGFSFLQIFCFNIDMFPLARSIFCIYISWIHFFPPKINWVLQVVHLSWSNCKYKFLYVKKDCHSRQWYANDHELWWKFLCSKSYRVKQLCVEILFTYTWIHFVNSK
jgi:hypothetical protein